MTKPLQIDTAFWFPAGTTNMLEPTPQLGVPRSMSSSKVWRSLQYLLMKSKTERLKASGCSQ
jgi:hypothetical protein